MTDDRLDPELEAVLSDRAGALSSEVLRAVDAEVRRTPQVGPPIFERRAFFPRTRWPLAAAASVAILVLGVAAFAELAPGLLGLLPPGAGSSGTSTPGPAPSATSNPQGTGLATPGPSPSTVAGSLAGLWSTIDVDGSLMTITLLTAGDRWDVTSVDTRASACGGGPLVSHGTAPIAAGRIEAALVGGCVGQPTPSGATPTLWLYDAGADTLRTTASVAGNPIEFTWHRGPGPDDAFSRDWVMDSGGETRSLGLSGSGLSRAVTYVEPGSSRCAGQEFRAEGSGTIGSLVGEGRFLTVALVGGCAGTSEAFDWRFEYQVGSDTLVGPTDLTGGSLPQTGSWHS